MRLITPHRYTPEYDQSEKTGIYCVQFVTFKNNQEGRVVLEWWRNACLDWCYNRFEEGRFGDQKYLDDWPERFEGVYVSRNLGGGVAPWNMQQYEFEQLNDCIRGRELKTNKRFPVIFFHFHSFVFVTPDYFSPRPYYERNETSIVLLFKPYVKEIKQIRSNYPAIQTSELYLHGWKYYKYLLELLVRRGLKEKKYIKLLHEN